MTPTLAYVLIVITHVYYGSTVAMQEFSTKARCEAAIQHIESEQHRVGAEGVESLGCVPK